MGQVYESFPTMVVMVLFYDQNLKEFNYYAGAYCWFLGFGYNYTKSILNNKS